MGFFANRAAKAELRVRDMMHEAFSFLEQEGMPEELGIEFRRGNVLLPCHIIKEAHNGFFVGAGNLTFGIFRCQGFWWAHTMTEGQLSALRGPTAQGVLYRTFSNQPVRFGAFPGSGALPFASTLLMALAEFSPQVDDEGE